MSFYDRDTDRVAEILRLYIEFINLHWQQCIIL